MYFFTIPVIKLWGFAFGFKKEVIGKIDVTLYVLGEIDNNRKAVELILQKIVEDPQS